MQLSYSRIDCFERCKLKYRLRYLDGIKTNAPTEPDNALVLGTAVHTGIAEGVQAAVREYYFSYPVITDEHVTEAMKLEKVIPEARNALPPGGKFEVPVRTKDFTGYIDYLVPVDGWKEHLEGYDIYDFKYTANVDSYSESAQLHLYKYFFEKCYPWSRIRNLYYFFIPKIRVRQGKGEELQQYRNRITGLLNESEIKTVRVEFDPEKVIGFLLNAKAANETEDFPAEPGFICRFCEYRTYCESDGEYDYDVIFPWERR